MKINLKFSHFEEIHKNGYTLDMVYFLYMVDGGVDVNVICCDIPRMEALCQTVFRKGLVTEEYKLTTKGKDLLEFIQTEGDDKKFVKKKAASEDFDRWWKAYPGTDTFRHKGKTFTGTRSMRVKKDECKAKFNKIVGEGEYTADEIIAALEYEILQKKENSVKSNSNKLTFMQNSLTYLNQRTFEPFIELIREGVQIKESSAPVEGTDI